MAKTEVALKKTDIIKELTRSPHGDLAAYAPVGQRALEEDAEFFAHLVAWNAKKGQVRDAKVALPVIALGKRSVPEFTENALAHLAALDPRNLIRGLDFARTRKTAPGDLRRLVSAWLRARESDWTRWERTALQHRESMKTLYARYHVKPAARAQAVLFDRQYGKTSIFETVRQLRTMPAKEAAGLIVEKRIPFLIAKGALGARAKEPELLLSLIESMSPTELVTNTKNLEALGVMAVPALRGAFEAALKKASTSKKATLKTTRAAEAMQDGAVKEKLRGLQERQLAALAVDGDWAVLADKSGSMEQAIEISRQVAATLAKVVKGKVHLVFFDITPRYCDVTGQTYDEILATTKHVQANGGTSIGCALAYLALGQHYVDGIAIVSDSAENSYPRFADVYPRYCEAAGKEIPVYLYKVQGEGGDALERSCEASDIQLERFDLRGGTDFYALPNLVGTMRTNRYSLVDEIMGTPLLTLSEALRTKEVQH